MVKTPPENEGYRYYLHNKDQMYFPKVDEIFGSKVFYSPMAEGSPTYKIKRIRWKALDTPGKRCTSQDTEANTTKCITAYMENTIGCSMGLAGSDRQIPM